MKIRSSIFLLWYLFCAPFVFADNDFYFKREDGHPTSLLKEDSEMLIAGSLAGMTDPVFTQIKKLLGYGLYHMFGSSVSISGDTAVVGATGGYGRVADSGSAYIFERNQGGIDNWGEVLMIFDNQWGEAGDEFGGSVSISGDTVVVGARNSDGAVPDSGAAYIFERDYPTPNAWGLRTKIFADDGTADDRFGISVSIDGDTVVIGAPFDDSDKGNSSGAAYIFERDHPTKNAWGQREKIVASDYAAFDNFGGSVSISGDTVVVGAFSDYHHSSPKAGSAYIFNRDQGGSDNWGQVKKIIASDYATNDQFGVSVSISGDTVVVGAILGNGKDATNTGSAYIFERDYPSSNAWGQRKKIFDETNGALGDKFGISVSIDGDTVVVGADFYNEHGAAYIFDRHRDGANNWGSRQRIVAADPEAFDWFGAPVSISGDTVVVGASGNDDNYDESGSAYIYEEYIPKKAIPWLLLLLLSE